MGDKDLHKLLKSAVESVAILQESQIKMQKTIEENIVREPHVSSFFTPPTKTIVPILRQPPNRELSATPRTSEEIESVNMMLGSTALNTPDDRNAEANSMTNAPVGHMSEELTSISPLEDVAHPLVVTVGHDQSKSEIRELAHSHTHSSMAMPPRDSASSHGGHGDTDNLMDELDREAPVSGVQSGNDPGELSGRVDISETPLEDQLIDPLDAAIADVYGYNDEREGLSVGVIHELKGPALHPHEVETARRGIIDEFRKEGSTIKRRIDESATGYVFWRYRAWILIANRVELRVDGEDSVFYISAQFMADLVGIEGSMEEVEDVDEWIGLNIIDQIKSDKEKMIETLLGEIASIGGRLRI